MIYAISGLTAVPADNKAMEVSKGGEAQLSPFGRCPREFTSRKRSHQEAVHASAGTAAGLSLSLNKMQ